MYFNLTGHSRTIEKPGCVKFRVKLNACRGYCVSYTIPIPFKQRFPAPEEQETLTKASCCNTISTEDIYVTTLCHSGFKKFTFKSAKDCSCSMCRKGTWW